MENIIERFNPGPHHKVVVDHIKKNNFSVILNSYETGITRSYALFLLEYISQNENKRITITASSKITATEVKNIFLDLLKEIKDEINFSVSHEGANSVILSNGCSICVYGIHKNTVLRSTDTDCLIIMDMAQLKTSEIKGLYEIMFVNILAKKDAKMILSSSPNGTNLFYDIFSKAELSQDNPDKSNFAPLRLYYWQVPGRDSKWVQNKIKEIGDDLFQQRFNLSWNISGSSSGTSRGFWLEPDKLNDAGIIGFDIRFKYKDNDSVE